MLGGEILIHPIRALRALFGERERMSGPAPDPTFWISRWRMQEAELTEPMKRHPWVYRACTVITDALTSVPFRLYTGDTGDIDDPQEIETGPWYQFFLDPNPEMTASDFWTLTTLYQLLPGGETFWVLYGGGGQLVRGAEVPRYAWPMSGHQFKAIENENGALVGWEQRKATGAPVRYDLRQIVHLRLPNPYEPRRGLSPLDAAGRSVRTDHKAHRWNEATLDNSAQPSGILKTTKDTAGHILSDEQRRQIKLQFQNEHGGPDKHGKTAVLDGLEWQSTGMSPKDMEFAQQREWSRQEIAAAYGIPLFLMTVLGDVHRETSREALKLFWENAIKPLATRMEKALERDLFASRGGGRGLAKLTPGETSVWGEWDFSGVSALQQDESEKATIAETHFRLGVPWEEINRKFEMGYEDHEGGDVSFIPAGFQPLVLAADTTTEEPSTPAPPSIPPEQAVDEEDLEEPPEEGPRGPALLTSKRRAPERERIWRVRIARTRQPGEKKMKAAYVGWMRNVRRELLTWVSGQGRAFRDLTPEGVEEFLAKQRLAWEADVEERTRPVTEWIVGSALSSLEDDLDVSIPEQDPRLLAFVDQVQARKVITPQTVQKHIAAQLIEGLSGRETVTQLQDRIRLVMNATNSRALTIARTETGMAATGAAYEAYGVQGVTKHSWLSDPVDTSREDHVAADGVVVNVGEPFPVGSPRLLYPLDLNGSAGDVINCRCDSLPED